MLEQFLIYMCLKKTKKQKQIKVVWVLSRKLFLKSMFALDIERLTLFYSHGVHSLPDLFHVLCRSLSASRKEM